MWNLTAAVRHFRILLLYLVAGDFLDFDLKRKTFTVFPPSMTLRIEVQGLRYGSVVKRKCCSSTGLGFGSQYPSLGSSQSPLTLAAGGSDALFCPLLVPAHNGIYAHKYL